MNLIEKQKIFAVLIAKFVLKLTQDLGYEVTEGESWRPPETAKLYSQSGKGVSNSLHSIRLAKDLNLFYEGKFLTRTEDYEIAGKHWCGMSTELYTCVWGGVFGDGNHFSIEHNGVR